MSGADEPRALPMTANAELDVPDIEPDDERYWSVTTILKSFGDGAALQYWSNNLIATTAVEKIKTVAAMADDDPDAAIDWLKRAPYRPARGQRSATALGEDAHAAFEQWVVTGQRPALGDPLPHGQVDAELEPYLRCFELWLERFQPRYIAAEVTVYSERYRYAGTADGYAVVDGVPVIVDYKTSKQSFDGQGRRKRPWSDVALQLAGYRHAEHAAVWRARRWEKHSRRYYLLNPAERDLAVPTPAVQGGLCIHVTPHHCDVFPVDCGDEVHTAFLYAIEAARWSTFTSKKVLGEPLALMDRKD